MSIVRHNLLNRPGYRPYCGNVNDDWSSPCSLPRTHFTGQQFRCPECGWESSYEPEFIEGYKNKTALNVER